MNQFIRIHDGKWRERQCWFLFTPFFYQWNGSNINGRIMFVDEVDFS